MIFIVLVLSTVVLGFALSLASIANFPRERLSWLLVILTGFMSIWAVTVLSLGIAAEMFLARLAFGSMILFALSLRAFISVLVTDNYPDRFGRTVAFSLAMACIALTTNLVVEDIILISEANPIGIPKADYSWLYVPAVALPITLGVQALLQLKRHSVSRSAFRTLYYGLLIGIASATTTNVVLVAALGHSGSSKFGFIAQLVWAFSLTGFTMRYLRNERDTSLSANKSKDEFISLASHQLRTPISAASLTNKTALDDDMLKSMSKEDLVEAIQQSQTQIEHMSSIVDGLLEAARIDNGDFKLNKTKFDLTKLASDVTSQHQSSARAKSIKLSVSSKPKAVTVRADQPKLHEVLSNFIDNAIKYSPESSSVKVSVSKSGNHAIVKVVDQGIGVSKEDQDLLFKKFGRAAPPNTNKEGLGIGLYLAKKTIDAHDGEIVFESEEGKGSTFGFSLPMIKSD